MGFISFKKFCLILIFVLLTSYYASAFRLIHTSQTHEPKTKVDLKESVKKLIEEEKQSVSYKEKYKNQTIKLQHKEKFTEDEDKVATKIISEKKIKPMQPTLPEITKEKILRAKSIRNDEKEDKDVTEKSKPVHKEPEEKKIKEETKESSKIAIKEEIARKIATKAKEEKIELMKTKEEKLVTEKLKHEQKEYEDEKVKVEPKSKEPSKITIKEEIARKIATKAKEEKIELMKTKEEKLVTEKLKHEQKESEDEKVKVEPKSKEPSKITIKEEIARKIATKAKEEKIELMKVKEEQLVTEKLKESEEKKVKDEPKSKEPVKNIIKEEIVRKISFIKPKEEKMETKKAKLDKVEVKKVKEEKIEAKKVKDEKIEKKKVNDIKIEPKKVKEQKKETKKVIVEKKVETAKKIEEIKPEQIIETKIFKNEIYNSSITSLYFNLPSFSPNFDVVENEECKKQGYVLIDQLNKRKLWALKMFDSTAKIPSGILKGNLNQLGDYDQCLSISTKIENEEIDAKIAGKYCLANIDFEAEIQEMKLPVHLAQSRTMIRSKMQDPGHFIPRFTTIRWGVCIPSGCSALDAETILKDSLKTYNESSNIGINFDVSIESNQCYVKKIPKRILDYQYETLATIGLTAFIILFTLIATIRDIRLTETSKEEIIVKKEESSTMEKIIMEFSLKRTSASLLRTGSSPDEIECIHGIRTICTYMLYIAHKLIPVGHLPFTNKITLTEISNNPFSIILRLSVIYTDSFLLLSGILTSYGMSKDMEEKGHIPWVNRTVARFIRLTPCLLFVLLYYSYVLEYLGDGPLWNTIMASNTKLCKENWWRNLIYIQNVYPFQEMCATHTHQLALDMQLFLIAPILVWLLYRRPLLGVFITILLHSVSVILRYYTTINYRLSLVIYHGISISQLYRTANMLYASSIHRATPYIAGVGLGVLLRQIKPNFSMPKIISFPGWLIAGYFATWTLYTPSHLSSRTYQYDINEAAQFAALCSLAWALALSWVIFSCFVNKEGILNIFLSSHLMIILSKISYTLYLTQFMVFFYNVGTIRSSLEFKIYSSIDIYELLIIITISTLLTLLVDIPVQKIKSILFKPAKVPKESESSESEINETTENVEKLLENVEPDNEEEENIDEIDDLDEILEEDEEIIQLKTTKNVEKLLENVESDNEEEENIDELDDLDEILEEDEEIIRKLENNILQHRKRKMAQSLSKEDE